MGKRLAEQRQRRGPCVLIKKKSFGVGLELLLLLPRESPRLIPVPVLGSEGQQQWHIVMQWFQALYLGGARGLGFFGEHPSCPQIYQAKGI